MVRQVLRGRVLGYDSAVERADERARAGEVDDAELVARWQAGDCAACRALFDRYYGPIAGFFRNKVSGGEDDLIQSTFLRCFEALPRLRERAAFRSFVFGIACNTLRERYREGRTEADRRALEVLSVRELVGDAGPSAASWLARRDEERLLLEGLRRLPVELQMVLELHYWERMKVREIAEITGAPEGTVKTRLRRGRELLEVALAELAAAPALLRSTVTDLDRWAEALRGRLGGGPG